MATLRASAGWRAPPPRALSSSPSRPSDPGPGRSLRHREPAELALPPPLAAQREQPASSEQSNQKTPIPPNPKTPESSLNKYYKLNNYNHITFG
jgi:hypothetical protein